MVDLVAIVKLVATLKMVAIMTNTEVDRWWIWWL